MGGADASEGAAWEEASGREEVMGVQFLPHTQAALDEYLSTADTDLEQSLLSMGSAAERIVPDCVGLSLTLYDEDLTFTLVSSDLPVPADDLERPGPGSPLRPTEPPPRLRPVDDSLLDEDRWALLARAGAAAGVASSLSLPVLHHGHVVGGISVYASSSDAFEGHHHALASAFGASASGAVTNADLAFDSRRRAEQAPRVLREHQVLDVGVGILAAREGLDVATAHRRLEDAARRAGISDVQAALLLININSTHH
jgi:GAF domain-containing protein